MKQEESKNALLHGAQALLQDYFAGKRPEELLETFFAHLKAQGLGEYELHALLQTAKTQQETLLPITLFSDERLSALELITKYLKENKRLTFHRIAILLKRDDRTIWATYTRAKRKCPDTLSPAPTEFLVPAHYIADRSLSVLESIVHYLHTIRNVRFSDIARLLHRNDSTVWTVYSRATKKKGGAA